MFAALSSSRHGPPPAEAQGSTPVDKSSCPSTGTPNDDAANPLEGPLKADYLEDDPTETLPEPPPDEGRPSGPPPNENLKPILRPVAEGETGAAASASADTGAVELSIRWCILQPDEPVDTEPPEYQWEAYDEEFDAYVDAGIPIRTVRVLDAPEWAIDQDCIDLVEDTDVTMCPPVFEHYNDFKDFSEDLAEHYGSASRFTIDRFALWNEPNTAENWGVDSDPPDDREPLSSIQDRADAYSDLLARFHNGLDAGDPGVSVDAGELAAGGETKNGTRRWTDRFAAYNSNEGRDDNFDVLTIHAYSETPDQVPEKVRSHRDLPGVTAVGVTEVAWGIANESSAQGRWKCVSSNLAQRNRLVDLMDEVHATRVPIHRVAWFSVIDNKKAVAPGESVKCPDNSGYYANNVRDGINTFGLFKRQPDGSLDDGFADAVPRQFLLEAFQNEQ
ncbi:hypothetical protein HJD18_14155 [Thermoleophilia bacterium SCSIO 60948]|nr:hypothetical protein HJD18_14155 [Thermoleophilia bacterium SCSIO 60948]